jgi:hypothetical protein
MTQIEAAKKGMIVPMSTMPGEGPGRVYAAPMAAETTRFYGGATLNRPALVRRRPTRRIGEPSGAAEMPVETHEAATLRLAGKRSGLGAN